MHLSDTIVLGPLPLLRRSLRLPLGATLTVLLALLLAGVAAILVGSGSPLTPVAALGARLPIALPGLTPPPTSPAASAAVRVTSMPAGSAVLLDGQMLGQTPTMVALPPGHNLVLRRPNATDVTVVDPGTDLDIPVWQTTAVLPVRAPMPGGTLTDVQVLADGRLTLAVASIAAPNERQAWLLDPARAHLERVSPPMGNHVTPAGMVAAPDGQHTVALVRGLASAPNAPNTSDVLLLNQSQGETRRLAICLVCGSRRGFGLDEPKGRRPLLSDGVLARDERVRDLSWAPDSRTALIVTQRPVVGSSSGAVRVRLLHVSLSGAVHNLVELPVAPF